MGKINSRNKGASFEREVASHLNKVFEKNNIEFKVKRNLEQYQIKDQGDLDLPNHTIECKRYASGNWYKDVWWEQVVRSCGDTIPVLIWKYNHQPIRVCVPMYYINPTLYKGNNLKTVVITFEDWLVLVVNNL
tara:strand:- start:906 stop:1304 length:399 start_codon:yes stop_codon:yes gene_type:complete